jgi:hypothetical protein
MSIPELRLVHFLLMFVYIAFALLHIYTSILIDVEERNGELSSIITGYKANLLEGETLATTPAGHRHDKRRSLDRRHRGGQRRDVR